jgi:hypothetical protein
MKRANVVIVIALFLTACIVVLPSLFDQYAAHALTGSFTVTEPPPTPTPTPNPAPTFAPTRTPNPDDGSTDKPEPGLKLTINIVGKTTEWMQNKEGLILENIATSSRDRRIVLYISIGTIILGPDAKPLNHIFTGVVDPFTKSPPSDIPDKYYFVNIYEFIPEGTKFSKPVNIKLSYEESDIPGGIDETSLKVFNLNSDTGEWTFIPSTTNPNANTVTFATDHFSIYALTASAIPNSTNTPTPTVSPTPTSTNTNCNLGIWIIIILIAECLIINTMLLVYWRNKNRSSRKYH